MHILILIFLISTSIKTLLIKAYYSTDFEVHRNWLAITHSLPLNRWYVDSTSEWTLDYPPFFAYFEWLLSQIAQYVDPLMLVVENLNYASELTVLFQRSSVMVMDVVYALGVHSCLIALGKDKKNVFYFAGSILLLLNVGLIMVDHIHFQYNGFLFGILLLSISALLQERFLLSAFAFAILLNFKHIFLYIAPAFAVYLLRFYCLEQANSMINMLTAFVKLLAVGLTPFALSFGPFWRQIPQVLSRLFPFKRGLTHAYWAPNVWALYNTADKVATTLLHRGTNSNSGSTTTSGLVQEIQHDVLPSISPAVTFALTFLFMLPILKKLFLTASKEKAKFVFLRAVVLCACCSFMFGWHVHEKAILMCLIPLCLLALLDRNDAKYAFFLSVVGYFSLFPLLFDVDLLLLRYTLYISYISMMYVLLILMYQAKPNIHLIEWLYIFGFVALPIYEHLISPLTGLDKRLPFMPLLQTSLYSALGVSYFFVRYYIYALDISWKNIFQKRPTAAASKLKTK